MTVRLEGTVRRYIGLSTDEKPVPGVQIDGTTIAETDFPAGSSFLESDTGSIYRWDADPRGGHWWLPEPGSATAASADEQLYLLQAILREITQMRELTELRLAVGA